MKKIAYLFGILILLNGCVTTSRISKEMYSKNILTEEEFKLVREDLDFGLIEQKYSDFLVIFRNLQNNPTLPQDSRELCSRIIKFIESQKKQDKNVTLEKIITDMYKNKRASKEEFDRLKAPIDTTRIFVTNLNGYKYLFQYSSIKAKDVNLPTHMKKIYSRINEFSRIRAIETFQAIQRRRLILAAALQGMASGLSQYGKTMTRQSYQPRPAYVIPRVSQPIVSQPMITSAPRQVYPAVTYSTARNNNYVANSIGNFDYVSGSRGYSGTGQRIGNFYYYNDNKGGSYTAQKIGQFDYVSGSDGYSGSGQKIGNFYYYNDNQRGSYTGQSIGKFDYISGSGGYSGTGQKIGNFYYYNDNE